MRKKHRNNLLDGLRELLFHNTMIMIPAPQRGKKGERAVKQAISILTAWADSISDLIAERIYIDKEAVRQAIKKARLEKGALTIDDVVKVINEDVIKIRRSV